MNETYLRKSAILKLCLFITGLAGIVAEFVLSTLASYLLGDSIFQWSLIISLMLFAMGLGSYLTRHIRKHLLDFFILTEFLLSVFCAISAAASYFLAGQIQSVNLVIYFLAIIIGLLIGLEIPLVTRINQDYEELRLNISSVMQYDYIGSLFGGLIFSFFALPQLGLTYTPIVLGTLNFMIAVLLWTRFRKLIHYKFSIRWAGLFVGLFLVLLAIIIRPVIIYSEQQQYKDKIIYQEQSIYQRIVVTQWQENYWLFINKNLQFSTYDEWRYHEPLVHPALEMAVNPENVLVLGGGDGMAVREILKHSEVQKITLVDLDPAMTHLGQTNEIFTRHNLNSLNSAVTTIVNQDAYQFLKDSRELFDVVIIDLPDPNNVELSKLYSLNFYRTVYSHLTKYGVMVTQATDASHATITFCCILKTARAAGFSCLPYRNYVPTMGNWGWVMGMKKDVISSQQLASMVSNLDFSGIKMRFLSADAMTSMRLFGKGELKMLSEVEVNTELNPVLHQYMLQAYPLMK